MLMAAIELHEEKSHCLQAYCFDLNACECLHVQASFMFSNDTKLGYNMLKRNRPTFSVANTSFTCSRNLMCVPPIHNRIELINTIGSLIELIFDVRIAGNCLKISNVKSGKY